jgi:uncharacterized membrane protein
MWVTVVDACKAFAGVYSDSAALRTAIGFAHVGGLVVSGGTAIAEDRAILAGVRARSVLAHDGSPRRTAHIVIVSGLTVVILSGFLLLAADLDTFLRSWIFWIKMGLVSALVVNGALLLRAERLGQQTGVDDAALRAIAIVSICLWLLTTLAGAALPNV